MDTLHESFELRALAEAIRARYPTHVGFVALEKIVFYEDVDPEPAETAPHIRIAGLTSREWRKRQYDKADDARYIVTCTKLTWDQLNDAQRQWLMFEMLYSVDANQGGKVRRHEVREFAPVVEFLGIHWRQDAQIPDLLAGEYPLTLPPPPPDHDVPTY